MSTKVLIDTPAEERLNILMITRNLPYPPTWGFGVRVFQLARALGVKHNVTLLAGARRDERESVDALGTILRVSAVDMSQAGIDGDLETRDWSLERGTPRSCHDRGSTPMS